MKTKRTTETITKIVAPRIVPNGVKSLSLEEIEQKMIQLATTETDDMLKSMLIEKKIAMLEKVANIKLKRLQLKDNEKGTEIKPIEPITIKFVRSDTPEQQAREKKIDDEILAARNGSTNA